MLWKTIIKRAEQIVLNKPTDAKVQALAQLAKRDGMSTWQFLRQIDVRCAGELRTLLPEAFPKKLQRLPLKVDQNIHSKWRVKATKPDDRMSAEEDYADRLSQM